MTKSALLITALATLTLSALPAEAQRVFVSGSGSDTNPCTFAQPCRSFQQAYNTAPDNGEIDVLDPAGYGPLNITHGISIQAHGFGGITAASGADAIDINVTTSDPVTLNGLLLDGAGSGNCGICVYSAGSVQILGSVIRHFGWGIYFTPTNSPTSLLVSDTTTSDNGHWGLVLNPQNNVTSTPATLIGVIANNNGGFPGSGGIGASGEVTIVNSVSSNNTAYGLFVGPSSTAWIANSVVSGNALGIWIFSGGTLNSYGNNDVDGNVTDVMGSLTPVSTE